MEKPLSKFLQDKEYNTIILGTSRTYQGIHPENIKSPEIIPFKWSHVGNGPKYNYHFYRLYKKIKGAPKIVILGVDYFIYSITTTTLALSEVQLYSEENQITDYFSPTLLLIKNKSNNEILLNDIISSFKISEQSLYKKLEEFQIYTGIEKSQLPNFKVITKRPTAFKRKLFVNFPGKEGDYFLKMLDEMQNDGTIIIFVVIPDHIGTFNTNISQRRFRRHLRKLYRKYKKLKVLNYNLNRKFDLKDESLFIDGGYNVGNSHMSKKGSALFNKLLKSDLIKIIK